MHAGRRVSLIIDKHFGGKVIVQNKFVSCINYAYILNCKQFWFKFTDTFNVKWAIYIAFSLYLTENVPSDFSNDVVISSITYALCP